VAVGWRAEKSGKTYKYTWYLKIQFAAPEEGANTRADKLDPKTLKLTAKGLKTIHKFTLASGNVDGVKRVYGDTSNDNFSGDTWFAAVQTPGYSAPSALALSSSTPADAATGVSVSANLTLTFNNVLPTSAINRVAIFKASDGTLAPATVTIDSTRKILTLDPTSNLTASTAYILTYSMVDAYGQTLSGAVNFTTA
jgi:methionine-rich copper-binding protein CopC